jgi:hypothetical protein
MRIRRQTVQTLSTWRGWLFTAEGLCVSALLLATLALYLALAPFLHFRMDLSPYAYWGDLVRRHFFHPYSVGGLTNDKGLVPAYPPFVMYVFGVVETMYFAAMKLVGVHDVSRCVCDPLYSTVLKTPAILAHVATVGIIYALGRKMLSWRGALVAAATYAFTPAVLIDILVWGQTDDYSLLLVLAAMLLAFNRRPVWTGIMLGVIVSFKPQPILFVPLILIYLYRWVSWRQAVTAVASLACTAFVIWSPYLLPPHPEILAWKHNANRVLDTGGPGLIASRGGYNLWWLLGLQQHKVATPFVGPFSIQQLDGVMFGALVVLGLSGTWLDGSHKRVWTSAALLALAFFDVGILQYERYIFPAIALLLLAGLYNRRHWLNYALVSAAACVNLAAVAMVDVIGNPSYLSVPPTLKAALTSPVASWSAAGMNVVAFLLALALYSGPLWRQVTSPAFRVAGWPALLLTSRPMHVQYAPGVSGTSPRPPQLAAGGSRAVASVARRADR